MPRKLLYVGNDAGYFMAHRYNLAAAAKAAGWEVHVASPPGPAMAQVGEAGFVTHEIPVTRSGLRPDQELMALISLWRLLRRLRPDIVHAIALKAIVLSGVACRLSAIRPVVLGVMGLGHVFTERSVKGYLIRCFVRLLLPLIVTERARLVHQNGDDLKRLSYNQTIAERSVLIRGSGVDIEEFRPSPEPDGCVAALLPARMIWKKGVGQFVEAARRLKADGVEVRMLLAGDTDPGNPLAIPRDQLIRWHDEGVIEWLGHQTDMPGLLGASHIVVLPTYYGEGLPQSLLEAAACGRGIVTTDTPGCNDAVHHEENGLLVAPQDTDQLTAALRRQTEDPSLRRQLGERGRVRAVAEFSTARINAQVLQLYEDLVQ